MRIWKTLLALAVLLVGAQGVASAVCMDPAFMTVLQGPGNTLKSTVQSPDQDPWEGWVTMTVEVAGQSYTFSYPVDVPAQGTRSDRLFFSGTLTLIGYEACNEPDGMTESPEPVAIAQEQN